MAKYGRIDVLVSNVGIQIVKPIVDFPFADWKRLLAVHLDGAFLTTKACLRHMYKAKSGSVAHMGSVQAPYVTVKHGLLASAASSPRRAPNTMCVLTSTPRASCTLRWWTSKFPEQAKELGISEEDVTEHLMLKDTVDGEFTTTDLAEAVLFFADFKTNALTGQSLVVSHGWFME